MKIKVSWVNSSTAYSEEGWVDTQVRLKQEGPRK